MTARILVVDDQPELAELLQVVLEGEGHVVTAVHSGEAALARLARQPCIRSVGGCWFRCQCHWRCSSAS